MNKDNLKKIALIVLDGWGIRKESKYNAIATAHTPNWDKLVEAHDLSLLSASGNCVGLPEGQMGNSEVGHMHIGSGQVIEQDLVRINNACNSGDIGKRLKTHIAKVKPKKIHLVGLYSHGGVHAHSLHWQTLLDQLCDHKVLLHPILDGRDTAPKVAHDNVKNLEKLLKKRSKHQLASVSGRFYAMDRDSRWERTDEYVNVLSGNTNPIEISASKYIKCCYQNNQTDEFLKPVQFNSYSIDRDDLVITLNFRPDRMVQLVQRLMPKTNILCMTDYGLNLPVLFEKKIIQSCLGSVFEDQSLSQVRIAETEKFPHVTYFFNGGRQAAYKNELRELVASPKVKTYNEQPEMSAHKVCDKIIQAMGQNINGIFANFANADMVGHTGDFNATLKAIETIDDCIGKIIEASQLYGYQFIITADHGNAESMKCLEKGEIITSHTCSFVPFITNTEYKFKAKGSLCDIAPTLLEMLSIEVPKTWDGKSLLL